MYKKTFGDYGEWLTENEYRSRGYKILERNFKALGYKQLGEIDIVVCKGKDLVFVEVKTRSRSDFMDPLEAVGFRKQKSLIRAIKAFIMKKSGYENHNVRVDVSIVETSLDGKANKVYIVEDAIQDIS